MCILALNMYNGSQNFWIYFLKTSLWILINIKIFTHHCEYVEYNKLYKYA